MNPAGVRELASPTSAEPVPGSSRGSRRPDARTGRARARLSLLPVLALLLGTLGLFAATPAQAQTPTPQAPTVFAVPEGLDAWWYGESGDTFELQYKETSAPDRASFTGADPALGWVYYEQRLGRTRS